MAYNFSANQFEQEFKAKRLGNWEVPKWYPDRPRGPNKYSTQIIVNDRGHLLPGITRSNTSPWGNHYIGTWDLPKKISRELATELSAPPAAKIAAWERRSAHAPIVAAPEKVDEKVDQKVDEKVDDVSDLPDRVNDHITALDRPKTHHTSRARHHAKISREHHAKSASHPRAKSSPDAASPTLEVTGVATSGSRTSSRCHDDSPRRRPPTGTHAKPYEPGEIHKKTSRRHPFIPPSTPPNVPGYVDPPPEVERRPRIMPTGPPLANAYSNFQIAKQFHDGNLRHQPLPDTIEDAMYRRMEAQGMKNPGMALDVKPQVAAVGYRAHGVPNATQCSKLRVYRPKTAGVIPEEEGPDPPSPGRPRTSVKRSKLRRQKHVTEMELAICWDLKPGEGMGEPRPSPHIDGSRDSAGPAVFTLVQPVVEVTPPQQDCGKEGGCGTLDTTSTTLRQTKSPSLDVGSAATVNAIERLKTGNPKTAWAEEGPRVLQERLDALKTVERVQKENSSPNVPENGRRKHSGARRDGSGSRRSQKKDSFDSSLIDSVALARRKHYQSSPNLTLESKESASDNHKLDHHGNNNQQHDHRRLKADVDCLPTLSKHKLFSRPCVACEVKTPPIDGALPRRPKSEYKMAFKAGKPSNSFDSGSGSNTRPTTGKPVRMPKAKPIVRRSYSIDTLAPPFSLWPGNGAQSYPETWRLASVYQHAYKPIEARRRPLIESVFV